jgi:hypothetical protein
MRRAGPPRRRHRLSTLPDQITREVASDPTSYEITSLGATSLAIRPLKANARPTNLAIATDSIAVRGRAGLAVRDLHPLRRFDILARDLRGDARFDGVDDTLSVGTSCRPPEGEQRAGEAAAATARSPGTRRAAGWRWRRRGSSARRPTARG